MSVVGGGDGIGAVIDIGEAVDVSDSLATDATELVVSLDRDMVVLSEVNSPVLQFIKF